MATAKKKTTDAKPAYTFESKPLMDIVNTLLSGAISSDLDVTVSQFAPSSQALFQKCGMELTDVVLRYQFDEERGQGYLTRPQVAQGVGQFADTVVFATPTFMAPLRS
jgi:ABC-type proline/glycine betaine transport system substrate-binding protein